MDVISSKNSFSLLGCTSNNGLPSNGSACQTKLSKIDAGASSDNRKVVNYRSLSESFSKSYVDSYPKSNIPLEIFHNCVTNQIYDIETKTAFLTLLDELSEAEENIAALIKRFSKDEASTALFYCCKHNYSNIARGLIKYCSVEVNTPARWGNTALHHAARYNNLDVCKVLIDSGANGGLTNFFGDSPLHIAGDRGYSDIWDLLRAAGSSQEPRNLFGNSPQLTLSETV